MPKTGSHVTLYLGMKIANIAIRHSENNTYQLCAVTKTKNKIENKTEQ